MSDSQAYEEVRISSDGVTVAKRFEEDEFPVPAIAFEFSSAREEPVTVTLVDEVPEGVAVEDLGFHPEYGSEFWTIDDETITFEKELEPNAEYTTVYGIRATGTDDVEQFLTEPAIEEVDPPLPEDETVEHQVDGTDEEGLAEDIVPETDDEGLAEDIVPETDDEVVKDVISGEGSVPGLDDEEDEETDEDIEKLDLKDPNDPGDQGGAATGEGGAGNVSVAAGADSVIGAIAREIREEEASIEDLRLVTRAIDELSDRNESGVEDARVERLQKDIADLRAYTDALEEFLEENGTGEALIEDFESRLDEFSDSLRDVEQRLSETTDTVESVRTEMDDVSEEVSAIGDEVESVSEEVDTVEATVDDLESSLSDVEAAVDDLEEEVADGDVAGRLESLEEDIDDLREWQEQIKNTFGG